MPTIIKNKTYYLLYIASFSVCNPSELGLQINSCLNDEQKENLENMCFVKFKPCENISCTDLSKDASWVGIDGLGFSEGKPLWVFIGDNDQDIFYHHKIESVPILISVKSSKLGMFAEIDQYITLNV